MQKKSKAEQKRDFELYFSSAEIEGLKLSPAQKRKLAELYMADLSREERLKAVRDLCKSH